MNTETERLKKIRTETVLNNEQAIAADATGLPIGIIASVAKSAREMGADPIAALRYLKAKASGDIKATLLPTDPKPKASPWGNPKDITLNGKPAPYRRDLRGEDLAYEIYLIMQNYMTEAGHQLRIPLSILDNAKGSILTPPFSNNQFMDYSTRELVITRTA